MAASACSWSARTITSATAFSQPQTLDERRHCSHPALRGKSRATRLRVQAVSFYGKSAGVLALSQRRQEDVFWRLHQGGAPFRCALFGQQVRLKRGESVLAVPRSKRGARASAGTPEPSAYFQDDPSSYLPGLFDGNIVEWLPDSLVAECIKAAAESVPSASLVSTPTEESERQTGFEASSPTYSLSEGRLPSEIKFSAKSDGPVPVVVQLSDETLELFRAQQTKRQQTVFMYLTSLLSKGASTVVLLGGAALISVTVSLLVLERAGVKPQLGPLTGQAPPATAMPKVLIRKTAKPAAARGESFCEGVTLQ
jgi:hypothetical protein